MKKQYIAPDLYFESFELSGSIAAGCGSIGIDVVKGYMELRWFFETTPSNYLNYTCTDYETYKMVESYCYWDGTEGSKVFLS